MKVGITGSRVGPLTAQTGALEDLLLELQPIAEFHHGDCIGVDAYAHDLVQAKKLAERIVIHPPSDGSRRAFKVVQGLGVSIRAPMNYLDRNKAIVASSDVLIALPTDMQEQQRSGTWHTIRFARYWQKTHRLDIHIVWPNGAIHSEVLK